MSPHFKAILSVLIAFCAILPYALSSSIEIETNGGFHSLPTDPVQNTSPNEMAALQSKIPSGDNLSECPDRAQSLPIIDYREDLANILEAEGKTVGLEIGVQQSEFSSAVLERWTNCERYILLDPWQHQEHYEDGANVAQDLQEKLFMETKQRLSRFEGGGVELRYIRDFSSNGHREIADNSLDFIYFDARHDYQAMREDLLLFWPKLKCGGIFAGHDFCDSNEEPAGRWCVFADGTRCEDGKAVKAAVEEFAAVHGDRQIVVPRRENVYVSWYLRK